jgi:hypothetical protein
MQLEKYLDWYGKFDEIEKLKLISKKANTIKSLALRRKKALDSELYFGFNRVGKRGGKFTSLYANTQRITSQYLESIKELNVMVKYL